MLIVLVIDERGRVVSAEPVVRSSMRRSRGRGAQATWGVDAIGQRTDPNAVFVDAARRAALGWKFLPATKAGQSVRSRIKMELAFREPEPDREAESPAEDPTPTSPAKASSPSVPPDEGVEEVNVLGDRPEPSRTASLSRAEVREIPGTFGDPFRAVEAMPGVTPIVSGLPFFFVRGAPPGNVGYYLDGVRVPLLFHVGAGPSVVHPGLISRVDLYPGGYPARFGRFAGGIVSGETEPPTPRLRGEYNVRLFDAGALVETPFANGRGSVLVGGRYSYTGLLLTQLSPDVTLDYWDYQARASYDVSDRDRVSVFAFGSHDFLGQKTPTETLTLFGTDFHRIDLRYDRKLRRGRWRTAATIGQDRSLLQQDRFVRDRPVGARTELVVPTSKRTVVRAGTDLRMDRYDVGLQDGQLSPSAARAAEYFPSRTDLAWATRADVIWAPSDRFEVTPGARVDFFASQGATAVGVDPRLSTRVRASKRLQFLSSVGIAHQPPAFVVPVPGFQPGGLRGGLQRAVQNGTGIELDLGADTTLTSSLFYNAFFNMSDPLSSAPRDPVGCPPGAFPSDTLAGDRLTQPAGNAPPCGVPRFVPGTIGPDRSGGGGQGVDSRTGRQAVDIFEVRSDGSAYGLELYLKRKLTKTLGGFVSYTLSRSTRRAGGRTYVASFDRTHVANAAIAYDLGRMWRVGTRVIFYTGLPKAPDPTDPESTRLPAFFRVDARIEKRWRLGERAWIAAVAEWLNVSMSKEAVATRCTLSGCESQLVGPITIPSLGLEGAF